MKGIYTTYINKIYMYTRIYNNDYFADDLLHSKETLRKPGTLCPE